MSVARQSDPNDADPLIGTRVDNRYTIRSVHSRGGMGVVYAGVHDQLRRDVAIKVLDQDWASNAEAIDRFLQEARTASGLTHNNIVAVSDLGRLPDGRPYLVMPLIDGIDLATMLAEEGPQHPQRVAALLSGVASALDSIHTKGLIHHDIKPENLMLVRSDGEDKVLVLDFGIAGARFPKHQKGIELFDRGTPEFMPPEAATGVIPDHRGDIYALATVAFEMMTGWLPFDSDDVEELATQKITRAPSSMTQVTGHPFPLALEAVVARGLAARPADRYPSAGEFVRRLTLAAAQLPTAFSARDQQQVRKRLRGPELSAGPMVQPLPQPRRPARIASRARTLLAAGGMPQLPAELQKAVFGDEPKSGISEKAATAQARGGSGSRSEAQQEIARSIAEALDGSAAPATPGERGKAATDSGAAALVPPPPAGDKSRDSLRDLVNETARTPEVANDARRRLTPTPPGQGSESSGTFVRTGPEWQDVRDPLRSNAPPGFEMQVESPFLADDGAVVIKRSRLPAAGLVLGLVALIALGAWAAGDDPPTETAAAGEQSPSTAAGAPSSVAPAASEAPAEPEPAVAAVVETPSTAAAPDEAKPAASTEDEQPSTAVDDQPAAASPAPSNPAPAPQRHPKPRPRPKAKAKARPTTTSRPVLAIKKRSSGEPSAATKPNRRPGEAAALTREATNAMLRGELASAKALYDRAIAADRRHAPAWRSKGLLLERLGDQAGAATAYRAYLRLSPRGASAERIRDRLARLER